MNEAGNEVDYDAAVAVIGMAGRFPGAGSVNQLWDNLRSGRSGLRTLTEEELADAGVGPAQLADPSYVRVAGPLEAAQEFDAGLFGFSRLEAEMMDPQHRVFLECSYEVLERAGYPPTRMPGRVGVFAGSGYPDYIRHVAPRLLAEPGGELMMATGLERDSFASLASYKLGLNGPSMTVQTFCSTSLVAVHLAVQSLLNFECEAAIAGGAFIPLPQGVGYVYQEGGILSPDGKVRTFDSGARGSVNGSGVTAVLLKRLSEAIDDGDHIDAVILGSAVNNDGRACAGFTAPGVDGQTAVMEQAISFAGVPAETIGYVECHGTGTQLGDSIELAALARAYPKVMERPVVLGSLKPSIGHLDRASGTAGLIRAAMALSHKVLPATPDYENPNPTLAAERGRFTVLTRDQPWPDERHPRRAGVSSFGLAGTNAHVVLEEPPTIERPAVRTPVAHLLVLSARDETALDQATRDLADCLETRSDLDLGDVAFTLQQSRTLFPLRRAFLCADLAEARTALADTGNWPAVEEISREPVAVLDPESALAAPDQWWEGLAEAIGKIVPAAPALATPDAARRGLLDALGGSGAAMATTDGHRRRTARRRSCAPTPVSTPKRGSSVCSDACGPPGRTSTGPPSPGKADGACRCLPIPSSAAGTGWAPSATACSALRPRTPAGPTTSAAGPMCRRGAGVTRAPPRRPGPTTRRAPGWCSHRTGSARSWPSGYATDKGMWWSPARVTPSRGTPSTVSSSGPVTRRTPTG